MEKRTILILDELLNAFKGDGSKLLAERIIQGTSIWRAKRITYVIFHQDIESKDAFNKDININEFFRGPGNKYYLGSDFKTAAESIIGLEGVSLSEVKETQKKIERECEKKGIKHVKPWFYYGVDNEINKHILLNDQIEVPHITGSEFREKKLPLLEEIL